MDEGEAEVLRNFFVVSGNGAMGDTGGGVKWGTAALEDESSFLDFSRLLLC